LTADDPRAVRGQRLEAHLPEIAAVEAIGMPLMIVNTPDDDCRVTRHPHFHA
jgi:hypothetical protein